MPPRGGIRDALKRVRERQAEEEEAAAQRPRATAESESAGRLRAGIRHLHESRADAVDEAGASSSNTAAAPPSKRRGVAQQREAEFAVAVGPLGRGAPPARASRGRNPGSLDAYVLAHVFISFLTNFHCGEATSVVVENNRSLRVCCCAVCC